MFAHANDIEVMLLFVCWACECLMDKLSADLKRWVGLLLSSMDNGLGVCSSVVVVCNSVKSNACGTVGEIRIAFKVTLPWGGQTTAICGNAAAGRQGCRL